MKMVVGTSRVRELERRVRELERLLGRMTVETEFSRKRLTRAVKNRACSCRHGTVKGRVAMKAVADTLVAARSKLIELVAGPPKPRGSYRKAGDEPLLAPIHRLVDERPTYGYRRIARLWFSSDCRIDDWPNRRRNSGRSTGGRGRLEARNSRLGITGAPWRGARNPRSLIIGSGAGATAIH